MRITPIRLQKHKKERIAAPYKSHTKTTGQNLAPKKPKNHSQQQKQEQSNISYNQNISWLNGFKAANYLNSLVIGSWIIRSFNPSEIGMYGYANSVTEILASLAGLGITKPLLKDFFI